jgi:endonuclease/exonuclease/phosphatase (EEP) superfamily protein YafD
MKNAAEVSHTEGVSWKSRIAASIAGSHMLIGLATGLIQKCARWSVRGRWKHFGVWTVLMASIIMVALIALMHHVAIQEQHSPRQHSMTNNNTWLNLANQLSQTIAQRKKYELEEENIKAQLKLLQDNKSFEFGRFSFVCETRKGTVQYAKIPELATVDLDNYRSGEIETWRFKVLY